MKCSNECGECPYLKRCKPNPVRVITTFKRTCKEYYEEQSTGWCCIKYNPLFANCRDMALQLFKCRHNLSCGDSEALKTEDDVNEAFEIFKQIFAYATSLE